MDQTLDNDTQSKLRDEKIITENEVAIKIGDKHIAENIIDRSRRVIYIPVRLLEGNSNKRVLRG
jgi:hypothetical protein